MNPDAAPMHRHSLRFKDVDLEASYVEEQERKSVRPRRMAALVAGVFISAMWALSFLGIQPIPLDLDRIAVLSITFLGGVTLFYVLEGSRYFLRYRLALNLALFLLFSAFLIGALSLVPPASLAVSGLALVIVHTFGNYGVLRLRFPAATVGGWFTAAMFMGYQRDLFARREFVAMRALATERERSGRLLLNILPASIAARLKTSEAAIADHSDAVTVLFADIVEFTPLSARKTPQARVQLLDRIFTAFDALADMHGLEKIKTIGDAYMAAAGLPERRADHAQGMLGAVARIAVETGEALSLRIGLLSGPVVAGVIGPKKFIYDLWGDTVNTASRMESHGVPGAVHCSAATAALLQPNFSLDARGAVQIEGKGEMHTFLLAPSVIDTGMANRSKV